MCATSKCSPHFPWNTNHLLGYPHGHPVLQRSTQLPSQTDAHDPTQSNRITCEVLGLEHEPSGVVESTEDGHKIAMCLMRK